MNPAKVNAPVGMRDTADVAVAADVARRDD